MHVKQSICSLICYIFNMSLCQYFLSDDVMKVSIHILKYNINIFSILSNKYFVKFDNILMMKLHENSYFSISPLCISRIMKCIEIFFKCFNLFCFSIDDFEDMAICSTTYFLYNFIFGFNMIINVL